MKITLRTIDDLRSLNRHLQPLIEDYQADNGPLYDVVVKKHTNTRSSAINRLLFGLWYPAIQDFLFNVHGITVKTDDLHEELVELLLPMEPYTSLTGDQLFRRQRTSKFNNKQFCKYMEKLELHYNGNMDQMGQYPLPKPDDLINAAYGRKR